MTVLGVVTGAQAEARRLPSGRGEVSFDVVCAGGRAARAEAGARALIERGCAGLISFGLAGGLAPALGPGRLVVGRRVLWSDGGAVEAREAWTRALAEALAAFDPLVADVAAADRVVSTAAEKRALFDQTGAAAVDLESGAVAAAARAAGLPFAVLRVICDPAERRIPAAAAAGLDDRGRVRSGAVLAGLLRRPGDLAATVALARDARRALAVLAQAAGRLETAGLFGG